MKQWLRYLAQHTLVRLAWKSRMYGGKFKGKQPESLAQEEGALIEEYRVPSAPAVKSRGFLLGSRAF